MNKLIIAAATFGLLAGPSLADHGHDKGAHGATKAAAPKTADAMAVVKGVDARTLTVTLAHDPIPALKWPAQTATFKVASAAVLKGVAAGAKVHFVMENQGGKPVVTQIHPM